ncbi:MAG: DUF2971 domain-containing protein [Paramuribaculum sp.]|nr:DUF2971 domain-containing protein [Paramuribaculum sp.]
MEKHELEYYKSQNYLFEGLLCLDYQNRKEFETKLQEIRDIPIYKFMNLSHVISMIQNRKLWISKVSTWDDVYENILFKQNFFHNIDGGIVPVDISTVGNNIFGQCWTSQQESDAMWRIYSLDKNNYAVRIKTTIGKLMDAAFVSPQAVPTVFVGEVSYVDNLDITRILSKYVQDGLQLQSSMREYAQLLLLKRKEFEHEKEIRLIISEDTSFSSDHIELPIDPLLFIDEITLDSRLAPESPEYFIYHSALLSTGFTSGKVNRSTLYDLPAPVDIKIL